MAKGRTPKQGKPRARDASGRFLSARVVHQLESAEQGTVYEYNVRGTIKYRDERGRFVASDIAAATRGGAKRTLRTGGKTRAVEAPPQAERALPPKGWDNVLSLDVRGQSLSKLVEGNAVAGADTFIRYGGKTYRVGPDKAAKLSDTFRVLVSDYMQDFADWVDYPELTIETYETRAGDLIDLDRITLFHEGLEEELRGDPDAERAAQKFAAHVDRLMSQIIPKASETPKDPGRTKRRDKARRADRKRRK